MAALKILQSLWSMERRHTDGFERSLERNVGLIAGRDGNDTTGRWQESLQMKAMVERLDAGIRAAIPAGGGAAT